MSRDQPRRFRRWFRQRLTAHVPIAIVISLAIVPTMWWLVSGRALAESADLLTRAEAIAREETPVLMVTIPAGWFLMGSPRLNATFGLRTPYDDTEIPQRRIWLDAYAIDRDEVSLGSYFQWLLHGQPDSRPSLPDWLATVHDVPDGRLATLPVFGVTWFQADAYCRSRGKRLPTEAEWEKAARGVDGQLFPWGDVAPDMGHAVFDRPDDGPVPDVVPVDSMEGGRSPYGLHHMAGNVAEWVNDWSGIDAYVAMPDRNPQGPKQGKYKVVRGGSWRSPAVMLRAATRGGALPDRRASTIGFRCAR